MNRTRPRNGNDTHPASRRGAIPRLPLLLALMSLLLSPAGHVAGRQTPTVAEAAYGDVLPAFREQVAAATAGSISRYRMDVAFDPGAATLGGTMGVTFVNATGEPLDDAYFRLYPNAAHYEDGATVVRDTTVAGVPVGPELSVEDTVLRLPMTEALGGPLGPGERVELVLAFETTVPTDAFGSYGIFNHASATGTWVLADWHPILAGYEPAPGPGWRLDPPVGGVDPTFADSALYDVSLTAPEGWVVVASGSQIAEPAPGGTGDDGQPLATYRLAAGPARDFTMTIDDDYVVATAEAGETLVRAYGNPGREAPLRQALDLAAEALRVYGERFGPYPFAELDLVDTPLTDGTLGVSWAGVLFLDGDSLGGRAGDRQFYAFLLAHEVGHQWWGNIVGVNSNDHTFLVEGLTNYTMTLFVEWTEGREAALDMLETYVAPRYIALIERGGDQVADVPFDRAPPGFGDIVYGKGALGFLALRLEMGDEAFFAALARLAALDGEAGSFAFAIAEPDDVLRVFEETSGRDLAAIWRVWFQSAETTATDVERLLDAYADGDARR